MNDECCRTCHYFCKVRKWPVFDEILTNVCVLSLMKFGVYCIDEVTENDMCECYQGYRG